MRPLRINLNVIRIILKFLAHAHFVGVTMKVIIIGDSNVGKTSLLNRWIYGYRYEPVISNISAAFFTKRVEIDSVVQDVTYSLPFLLISHPTQAATLGHSRTRKISESHPHVLPVSTPPQNIKKKQFLKKWCFSTFNRYKTEAAMES